VSEEKVSIKDLLGLSDEDMAKPLPVPTDWSRPFWEGAREHKLLLKKCSKCGNIDHPPYLFCTSCMAEEHEWIEASGRGTLYSYAVNTFGVPFPFWDDMPYVLAIIDLDEGPRLVSNVVDCDLERLENGMNLEVVFDDVTPEVTLPKWKPAG
jgi:uncharacterized OB-fold protein